eukprot:TRINITY_DN40337_c0_g2_i1.p1 TRINITY_DN40337_c0_g2~~TRINITY_DN40337_c0_g2_i1.p1  ORF type:complete len:328 (-),score=129.81 TRINITY_DN40337_c0_g2_i1:215-1198(-)
MAALWKVLRDEVKATVDDFREKGAVGALRDAALDARDAAADMGSMLVDGVKDLIADDPDFVLRAAEVPAAGSKAVLELPTGTTTEVIVSKVDTVSNPPRAVVMLQETGERLVVPIVPPKPKEKDLPDGTDAGAAGAEEDGLDARGFAGSILNDLAQEWNDTMKDFKEKGAVGAIQDAALDAVDLVGMTAEAAVDGVVSLAKPLVDGTLDPFGLGEEELVPSTGSSAAAGSSSRPAAEVVASSGSAAAAPKAAAASSGGYGNAAAAAAAAPAAADSAAPKGVAAAKEPAADAATKAAAAGKEKETSSEASTAAESAAKADAGEAEELE